MSDISIEDKLDINRVINMFLKSKVLDLEMLIEMIYGEIELSTPLPEESAEVIIESIKCLIDQYREGHKILYRNKEEFKLVEK